MKKLPILSAKKIIKALEKEGFKVVRQKGRHISLYKKSEDKAYLVVVPDKKEIKRGTLVSILRQARISRDIFFELLEK